MKNTILIPVVAGVSCIVGASLTYAVMSSRMMPTIQNQDSTNTSSEVQQVTPDQRVNAEGILVRNQPDLVPDAWYVAFEEDGTSYAVQLSFDAKSECFGSKASGVCSPDRFVDGRQTRVEGYVDGNVLLVREMRFPVPLTE